MEEQSKKLQMGDVEQSFRNDIFSKIEINHKKNDYKNLASLNKREK